MGVNRGADDGGVRVGALNDLIAGDSSRYRRMMSGTHPGPAERLVELLETLPDQERREITAWLFGRGIGSASMAPGHAAPQTSVGLGWFEDYELPVRRLATVLPAGEGSQLVTIRLTADRHADLRAWCAEHGFAMAAVVRGLVERFLEQQEPSKPEE